jgi:lipid-binding SYLF domain-containing protein
MAMRFVVRSLLLALSSVWLVACSGSGPEHSSRSPDLSKTVRDSAEVFQEITNQPNAVPDGVLNMTKCVAVFPASSEKAKWKDGVVTCREAHDRWLAPSFVRFTPADHGNKSSAEGDLLILVIGDAGVSRVRAGTLALSGHSSGAGPTLGQAMTVTNLDVRRDALSYRRVGKQVEGFSAAGDIRRLPRQPTSAVSVAPLLDAVTAYFNSITPIGIIVHHSSTLTPAQPLPRGVSDVDQFHAQRGFDILCEGHRYHVAYHYLILTNGKVQAGRPERCEGAHSAGYNSYLGISVVGDFSSRDNPRGQRGNTRPTKQQMASLVTLSRQLMARYHIPLNRVLRHSDVARTDCPGDRFPFRAYLSELR